MRMLLLAAAVAGALPVPALARLEPTPARRLAGRVAGPARDCLPAYQGDRDTQAFASGEIAFQGRGSTVYLNHPSGCPRFGSRLAFVSVTPNGLCRGDTMRVIDPVSNVFYGVCILGDFTPYDRPGRR